MDMEKMNGYGIHGLEFIMDFGLNCTGKGIHNTFLNYGIL